MKKPTDFPVLLESFFTQRLVAQRRASPHTIVSYRDTFRLLLQFAQKRLHKPPSQLAMEPELAPDGDSVVLSLCGTGSPSPRRSDPKGPGHPKQEATSAIGRLFNPTRAQSYLGRA
jgi:hypothetical protein